MLKKLGLVDFHKALKENIEHFTNKKAYDYVPDGTPAPFYVIEVVDKYPEDTKVMWAEVFSVWIHAIAEENESKIGVYNLVQELEEALTIELDLPDGLELLRQNQTGIQSLQKDESGEWHAIVTYDFKVAYGFKSKI